MRQREGRLSETAGIRPPSGLRLSAAASALARAFEQERDRWFLWLPVLYAIGIALYMALPVEPPVAAALTPALAAIALRVAWQRGVATIPVTACLIAVTLGVAGAKLRTMWIAAPKLEKELRRAEVAG